MNCHCGHLASSETKFRPQLIKILSHFLIPAISRDIIFKIRDQPSLSIMDQSSKRRVFFTFPGEDTQAMGFEMISMAINEDDSIFILTKYYDSSDLDSRPIKYNLSNIDDESEMKDQHRLKFSPKLEIIITRLHIVYWAMNN